MPISVLYQHTPEKVKSSFKGLVDSFKARKDNPRDIRLLISLKSYGERIQKSNSILGVLSSEHTEYLRRLIEQLEKEINTSS